MEQKKLGTQDSDAIYIVRGIAILSVITAHVNVLDNSTALATTLTRGLIYFGQLGVIIFFITGGYLYHRDKGDSNVYFRRKLQTLVLPWLACSFITYAISAVKAHNFSIHGYFKWTLGSGTWYYYIVVYLVFLFIFKWMWDKNVILVICICLTGASLYFGESFLPMIGYKGSFVTPYLNIFNWIGFFALGILIRQRTDTLKMRMSTVIIAAIAAMSGVNGLRNNGIYSYFSAFSYLFEVGGGILLITLSYHISRKHLLGKFLFYSGKNSYCIYLLHMQIVQFVCRRIPYNVAWDFLRPMVGLAVMDFLICLGYGMTEKFPVFRSLIPLFGLRDIVKSSGTAGM